MIKTVDSLAIAAAKLSAQALRATGLGLGSNLPGKLARKISPGLLSRLTSQRHKGVLAVSGTNGKSTTSGFVHSILRCAGLKIVHNRQGANLITGITASILEEARWDGKIDVDYCLFEIDEAALPLVAAEVGISVVLVTNLFRDQLDRFGELDTTAKLIDKGIKAQHSQAILNADDPNVAQLAQDCPRIFFGVESIAFSKEDLQSSTAFELAYCPVCGTQYEYNLILYGQLGHYFCSKCKHCRPKPDVIAREVKLHNTGSEFILGLPDGDQLISLNLPGFFNVYNALAAAALAHWLGIPGVTIKQGLKQYSTLFGRSEKLSIEGKSVIIQLIKNPIGASQVIQAVAQDKSPKIIIAINDNLADGRDISWLWDADFEAFSGYNDRIIVSGKRAEDMAMRLKYADITGITTIPSLDLALQAGLRMCKQDEVLWILPTYTCLLEFQKILKTMGYALSGT